MVFLFDGGVIGGKTLTTARNVGGKHQHWRLKSWWNTPTLALGQTNYIKRPISLFLSPICMPIINNYDKLIYSEPYVLKMRMSPISNAKREHLLK